MRGYLFIADITGYTHYLTESELEHARSTLEDLLNLLLHEIHPPLTVSKLEGDAVLAYTAEKSLISGQTLIDMVERIYAAFKRAVELMQVNTTCPCNACRNIPQLDLKFFVHHGEFATQDIGRFVELVGTDVNLVHRLTKNSVEEVAYAMYTTAALAAAGIEGHAAGFRPHTETYEHIGEVAGWVQDMGPVWERRKGESRVRVTPEESLWVIERDLPVPIATAWEYVTQPETRALVIESDQARARSHRAGRVGEGTEYVCAHGDNISIQTVVDWSPFDYYSYQFDPIKGAVVICTVALEDRGDTTHVTYTTKGITSGLIKRLAVRVVARFVGRPQLERGLAALDAKIKADRDAGILDIPDGRAVFDKLAVREAAAASVANPGAQPPTPGA